MSKTKYTLDYIHENGLVLLDAISGSHAYGLNTPTSDVDKRGVFIMEQNDIYGLHHVQQVSDKTNDVTYYELGRFMELAFSNNPNIIELLAIDGECLLHKHPVMEHISPELFLSKICRHSFGGYAIQQIKKARGLNKKIVQKMPKRKKTPLDFCFAIVGHRAIPLKQFLKEKGIQQKFCGVVNVPHIKDGYALYFDSTAQELFGPTMEEGAKTSEHFKPFSNKGDQAQCLSSYKADNIPLGLGYKGIATDSSNAIRLSSVPKGQEVITLFTYNKDGYTKFNKDHKEYWHWVANRNEARYNDNAKHGKGYDGKNLMHCHRLLSMAQEIIEGKGVIVRRPEREYLLEIRRGEHEYNDLVASAEMKIKALDEAFKASPLPKTPDAELINKLLIQMRHEFYTSL